MRKITDIYNEYKIMHNLQLHQIRVAAVAMQICDSLNIKIDKKTIITACIFHDMGNIIKFKLDYFPEFLEPEGLEYWQNIKEKYIKKYSINEHEATTNIVYELGLSKKIIELVSKNRFSNLCIDKDSDDWGLKILHYADTRVGPYGILFYKDRMDDAGERYRNRLDSIEEKKRQELIVCGKEIEDQIFSHLNIKPEDINDNSIISYMEKLKDFEI